MMVEFYYLSSSTSSRKAREFLESNKVDYVDFHMSKSPMTQEQLLKILSYTENGVYDILSTRSKAFQQLSEEGVDFDELRLTELHSLIEAHPNLLRAPIVLSKEGLIVGYSKESMQVLSSDREEKRKAYIEALEIIRKEEDKELEVAGVLNSDVHDFVYI